MLSTDHEFCLHAWWREVCLELIAHLLHYNLKYQWDCKYSNINNIYRPGLYGLYELFFLPNVGNNSKVKQFVLNKDVPVLLGMHLFVFY